MATAFASARLNLKFFEELPWHDAAGEPVIGGRTPLDLGDISGEDRLATLAVRALRECAAVPVPAARGPIDPPAPMLLCLPEPDPDSSGDANADPAGSSTGKTAELLAAIAAEAGAPIDLRASRGFALGRAGIFAALEEAGRLLAASSSASVYLGGVDSLVDRDTLDRWLRAGRIKTSTSEGVIPGEGAAFLRLGRAGSPGALAAVAGVARASEPSTRDADVQPNVHPNVQPNVGAGLAQAAREALAASGLSATDVSAFIHDAAGDRFGFREVSLAITRLRPRADPPPLITSTAACAGELGAAYGPFALALAAFFLRHGVTAGPATLVLGTSDGPTRGAAVVTPPRQG